MNESEEAVDFKVLLHNLRKAEKEPRLRSALDAFLSCPVERIYNLKADWVSAGGTDELLVAFHPGDGYREFMAAFRAVFG